MVTARVGVVGVAALVLAIGGAPTAGATPTASGDAAAAEAGRVTQAIPGARGDWRPCRDEPDLQCRGVRVPLDWGRPGGRSIVITVRRLPALDPGASHRSVVMNFGGPGEDGSALSLFSDSPVRRSFDLVSWDPRGVGSPPALAACDSAPMGQWRPRTGPFSWEGIARQAFRSRAQVNRACIAANRRALPYVGSNQVVRDMDAVRSAVGDRRLTYVGFSYGTRLGRLYAQLFPGRVRAMVLDGVTGPYPQTADYLTSARRGGTAAWRWIRSRLAPSVRELDDRLSAVLAQRTITVDAAQSDRWGLWWRFKSVLRSARATASVTSVTCQWAQAAGLPTTDCPPGDEAPGALQAAVTVIDCTDATGRLTPREIGRSLATRPIAGPAALNVIDYTTMCAGAPDAVDPVPPPRRTRLRTPPLLINGVADPSTPMFSARRTQRFLPGSRLVAVDTSIHGLFLFSGSTCVDGLATRYLRRLEPPARGTTCPTP